MIINGDNIMSTFKEELKSWIDEVREKYEDNNRKIADEIGDSNPYGISRKMVDNLFRAKINEEVLDFLSYLERGMQLSFNDSEYFLDKVNESLTRCLEDYRGDYSDHYLNHTSNPADKMLVKAVQSSNTNCHGTLKAFMMEMEEEGVVEQISENEYKLA